jgi:hypothetical protein
MSGYAESPWRVAEAGRNDVDGVGCENTLSYEMDVVVSRQETCYHIDNDDIVLA